MQLGELFAKFLHTELIQHHFVINDHQTWKLLITRLMLSQCMQTYAWTAYTHAHIMLQTYKYTVQ